MSDNKFTIRIQIQQPHQAIEEIYPDWVEPEIEYEETWNWRRIAIAAATVLLTLFALVYWLLGSDERTSSVKQAAETAETTPSTLQNGSISLQSQAVQVPSQSIKSIPVEPQDSAIGKSQQPPMVRSPDTSSRSTAADSSLEQFLAPVVQAKTEPEAPGRVIIPRQKPKTSKPANIANPDQTPQSIASSPDTAHVYRAQLTHAIESREPTDDIDMLELQPGESKSIYFYLHLKDLQKKIVRVLWFHDNKLDSRLTLQIHGDDWRTNASKQLDEQRTGSWRVELQDESGSALVVRNFTVVLR